MQSRALSQFEVVSIAEGRKIVIIKKQSCELNSFQIFKLLSNTLSRNIKSKIMTKIARKMFFQNSDFDTSALSLVSEKQMNMNMSSEICRK